ncbi:acyltransferase [Agrobacterium sp. MOPV5]|uniref:acyltransferase family protein n=1 Tax=Agrobacterium leguminum TaxID=2792015 RepID=UPI0018C2E872|nr:acyltransferase [Agrobacterium leguminum]MBG0511363.1 acyltransferase [Agrobacterium leguminum]
MIYNLQFLRAFAAILVFFYHSEIYWKGVLPSTWLFKLGLAGVDVFFVLSGFIMAATTSSRDVAATSFLSHRIFRIVPLYWIITLLFTFLFFSGLKPVGLMELTSEYLIKSLFFIPFLRGGAAEPIVTVGWTLNYEIFFYLLFSLCLFIPNIRARHPSVIILILLALLPRSFGSENFYAIYYGNPIILEFCLGIACYHCVTLMEKALDPKHMVPLASAFVAASVLFLFAPAFGLTGEVTTSHFAASAFIRPLTWGAAGFLAVLSAVLLERAGYVSRRGLVQIGNASYSIYLIHGLMLHGASKVVSVFSPTPVIFALATTTIALLLSIAAGLVLFRYLESPINKMLRESFTRLRVTHPSPS